MSHPRTPMASNANARKRPVETVDLTEDDYDEQPALKTPRSSQASGVTHGRHDNNDLMHNQLTASQPTQSQRDSWLEEEDANDTIVLSQEGANGTEETEQYEIYGMYLCCLWLRHSKPINCSAGILMTRRRHAPHQNSRHSVLYRMRDYWGIRLCSKRAF